MANKITQLVNESGDNLYPLAGGMAADSIGTEMLKDGSVTSDKIDSTTLGSLVEVTPLNQSKTWSGGGEYELLSGTIYLGSAKYTLAVL